MTYETNNPALRNARDQALATLVTTREREVLRAISGRRTNKEIADDLLIGVRTVESHVSSLLRKLWAGDRRDLEAIGAVHSVSRFGTTRSSGRSNRSLAAQAGAVLLALLLVGCGSTAGDDVGVVEQAAATDGEESISTSEPTTSEPTATAEPIPAEPTATAEPIPAEPTATAEPTTAEPTAPPEPTVEEVPADDASVETAPIECRNLDPCRAVLRVPSPLTDGSMVHIEIDGWSPLQTVGIAQCADPAAHPAGAVILEDSGLPHGAFCDVRSFTRVRSTRDGAVVWTFEVKAGARMADRTEADVTCDEEHACILNVFAADALMFRPDEPRVVFPLDFG